MGWLLLGAISTLERQRRSAINHKFKVKCVTHKPLRLDIKRLSHLLQPEAEKLRVRHRA